ncbi:hypothetical protein UXP70_01055 [Enterobacter cloacae]|uniref:hypothetical protein n=1 Tax=Enterobacter cloacae TaxID=550 RepID=UPI002FD5B4C7
MKKILLAVAILATFGAHADDFCRVVTFDSWTTVDAKGVHKENLKDNTNTEIFNYENGRLYYVMVDVQNPTMIDLFTYVGKMDNARSVTTKDSVNINSFVFYPHDEKFAEQDVVSPDEQLRDKGYKFSTQTIFGHYKSCTIQQKLLMQKKYADNAKSAPWMNY